MSEEIKEILDYLKPKYDIVDELGNDYKKVKFKNCKLLLDYITNLQQKVEQLEGQLEEKTYLYNKLETESKYAILQLENIRKRIIEYIGNKDLGIPKRVREKAFDILNKGSE